MDIPFRAVEASLYSRQLPHPKIRTVGGANSAAEATGHFGVGVVLESVLADKLGFLERDRPHHYGHALVSGRTHPILGSPVMKLPARLE